ncbi:MAG: high-potential iron-sulfur protein [Pseudomonadota bacterium]|nr:high-potential iron-sulfur protein [Pseudomonadota bacterium]
MNSRRHFIRLAALSGAALLAANESFADAPVLDEKDPQAVALGYVADAARANKAKYPKYAAGQACNNCQLYQGKAGSAMGPCPLFGGKQVAAKGWCSAYAKKAG